jgi:hypothetical protein
MRFADVFARTQEDTRKVKTQTTSQTVEVRADGEGLVSHAGAFLLRELADRIGLTAALSEAMAATRERSSTHDPGVVLRDWPDPIHRSSWPWAEALAAAFARLQSLPAGAGP